MTKAAASRPDHNRVLRDAARAELAPLGVIQVGRSRTWLDDRVWHVLVVEFQPSSWSKGSYLNVGVMWLWVVKDYISFDRDHRVAGFEEAEGPGWPERAATLARKAAARVKELRDELPDLEVVADLLSVNPDLGWPALHAGIALGLVGDGRRARVQLQRVLSRPPSTGWERDMSGQASDLLALVDDPNAFRARIVDTIARSRAAHQLEPLPAREIDAALEARAEHGPLWTLRRAIRDVL